MRSAAMPAGLLAVGLLLAGCAAGPDVSSSAHVRELPVSSPTPGTVEIYAPDPQRATAHGMWAFDVSDVREVISDADSVLIAQVQSIDAMGTFEFSPGGRPLTRVRVDVLRVLQGDAPSNGDLYVPGGTVTLQQVFESQPVESSAKSGLAEIDEKDRRNRTVDYVSEGPVRLEVGKEYVFMMRHPDESGIHAVAADGYGVFEAADGGYANRLTGDAFTVDELMTMTAQPKR